MVDLRFVPNMIDLEGDAMHHLRLSISVSPLLPSSANAIATMVFNALPCAPRVGEA